MQGSIITNMATRRYAYGMQVSCFQLMDQWVKSCSSNPKKALDDYENYKLSSIYFSFVIVKRGNHNKLS
jgi:hypothetical protein